MELNREQVIKALECCTKPNCVGFECPLYGDQAACVTGLNIAALSLIKELTEENERMRVENDELCDNIACLEIDKENAERRTVRKMQTLIENRSSWVVAQSNGIVTSRTYQLTEDTLDQIAKEMEEGV